MLRSHHKPPAEARTLGARGTRGRQSRTGRHCSTMVLPLGVRVSVFGFLTEEPVQNHPLVHVPRDKTLFGGTARQPPPAGRVPPRPAPPAHGPASQRTQPFMYCINPYKKISFNEE